MRDDETRVCRLCGGDPKPKSEFYTYKAKQPSGKTLVLTRTECRKCQDGRTRQYHRDNRDRHILNNSRRADKTNGLRGDLTREVIRELISKPCHYCGDVNERMGVDRVDNSVGHTVENCAPCCIRCNMLKRDMPSIAWAHLAPHVRTARELGLFGEWTGHVLGVKIRGRRRSEKPKLPDRRLKENRAVTPVVTP